MISSTWLIIGLNTIADVSSGFGIYTYFYYRQFGRHWWKKVVKKDYDVKFDPENGLTLALGRDPVKGVKTLYDNLTGANKTISETIHDSLRDAIKANIVHSIKKNLEEIDFSDSIDAIIKNELEKELKNNIPEEEENVP